MEFETYLDELLLTATDLVVAFLAESASDMFEPVSFNRLLATFGGPDVQQSIEFILAALERAGEIDRDTGTGAIYLLEPGWFHAGQISAGGVRLAEGLRR